MRLVHEDFFAPVVGDDEPEPFGRVEPFNCACAFLVVGEEREREREREAFDDDDEFTTKRRPDNRFQKQKKVIIKQFEREYKKRSRATFFRTHQRQFFSTSISNRRNLSPGVSFVIVLLSETDGEMCATFREMAVTFILILYFTFSVDTQANQFTPKNFFFSRKVKMARSGSLLGSRICPRSRFTLFFTLFSLYSEKKTRVHM